jgi:hypothetical protein
VIWLLALVLGYVLIIVIAGVCATVAASSGMDDIDMFLLYPVILLVTVATALGGSAGIIYLWGRSP